ncbi:MAG TPA: agmatine deiminase family protein [Myxococcota bacterium]|nr:agmatine deiminase family protein [Myxococcota bacterium]
MPAEWEPHAATWVAWPHAETTWPGCLADAEREFETLVRALAASEQVELVAQSEAHAAALAVRLGALVDSGAVRLHVIPTDDVWMRDIGPTFVRDGEAGLVALDWTFNAWGGKYAPWQRDDAVAARVATLSGVACERPGFVVEGGALEVDGDGTLLVTERTLLDPKRNPGISRGHVEKLLGELLGVRAVIWLGEGIEGDDTDGHIDDLARFVAPGRVVSAREPDRSDPNHEPLEDCARRLRAARDARGRSLEVIDLPMPPAVRAGPDRLPASYANFYVANRAVLVPTFGAPSDGVVLETLRPLFPGRTVVGIPSRALVRGLGAVHCLTQQQPAAPLQFGVA